MHQTWLHSVSYASAHPIDEAKALCLRVVRPSVRPCWRAFGRRHLPTYLLSAASFYHSAETHFIEALQRLFYLLYIGAQTHTHTHLTAVFPGLPVWASTRKVKPIWILLTQETVSGSGISWAICKSAPCSRQITKPAPHHSVFYRPDALPVTQPTASKHWREIFVHKVQYQIQVG